LLFPEREISNQCRRRPAQAIGAELQLRVTDITCQHFERIRKLDHHARRPKLVAQESRLEDSRIVAAIRTGKHGERARVDLGHIERAFERRSFPHPKAPVHGATVILRERDEAAQRSAQVGNLLECLVDSETQLRRRLGEQILGFWHQQLPVFENERSVS